MEGYSTSQVEQATGVSGAALHYWSKTDFLQPSIAKAKGTGSRRRWSFADVVAVRVANSLRQAGIPLQGLRRIVRTVRQTLGVDKPLAQVFLVADPSGKEVYATDGDRLIGTLAAPGQGYLFCMVVDVTAAANEMRGAVLRLGGAEQDAPAGGRGRRPTRAG
jgi:DNA-binding transcriptional MerR regulator